MTGTNHGLTGAFIALSIKQPALALPLSYLSHFVCDAIPHAGLSPSEKLFNKKFNITLVCDFLVAVSLMIVLGILFPSEKWIIWGCMIAAASPDLMWAYYELYIVKLKNKKPHFDPLARFHAWIQWSQTPKGWAIEVIWFVLMGSLILGKR